MTPAWFWKEMNNQRSVSSILKSARLAKGISLSEASKTLKIHVRFLTALEDGDYSVFSSAVHLKGFLKNYSAFLGLSVDEILAFFRREYPENEMSTFIDPVKPLGAVANLITPERLVSGFITLLVLLLLFYIFSQYRSFANAPDLIVSQPDQNFKTEETVIEVAGQTSKDSLLKINGQGIELSGDGSFRVPITLLDGVNTLNLVSENKLGKEKKLTRTVVLEKASVFEIAPESSPSANVPSLADLVVLIGPNAAWAEIFALSTNTQLFRGLMVAGVKRTFSDPLGFKVRSGNAGSTTISFAGQTDQVLGREGEILEREFRR